MGALGPLQSVRFKSRPSTSQEGAIGSLEEGHSSPLLMKPCLHAGKNLRSVEPTYQCKGDDGYLSETTHLRVETLIWITAAISGTLGRICFKSNRNSGASVYILGTHLIWEVPSQLGYSIATRYGVSCIYLQHLVVDYVS